jgi:hypothetical protein
MNNDLPSFDYIGYKMSQLGLVEPSAEDVVMEMLDDVVVDSSSSKPKVVEITTIKVFPNGLQIVTVESRMTTRGIPLTITIQVNHGGKSL